MSTTATVQPLFVNGHRPHISKNGNTGVLVDLVTKHGTRLVTWAGSEEEAQQFPVGEVVECLCKKIGDNTDITPTAQGSALAAFLNS